MTEKRQGKLIEVTYGRGLALLFSLTLALFCFCAAPSWAQSAESSAKTPTHATASAARAPVARAKSGGGNHEGITVHGHWIIEVKNPDGSLAQRRDFENALVTGGQGDTLLAALLGRAVSAGTWSVFLGGTTSIYIFESTAQGLQECQQEASPTSTPCFNTLTITPPTVSSIAGEDPQGTTLTLQGSVPSSFGAPFTVSVVATSLNWCASSYSSSGCAATNLDYALEFTSRSLDGLNGDPTAVSVTAGQTVSVTVVFSFR